jgi:hypothetical protein
MRRGYKIKASLQTILPALSVATYFPPLDVCRFQEKWLSTPCTAISFEKSALP